MYIVFLIGRIIVSGFFLMAAFNHFKNLSMYASYARSKGTPAPKVAAGGTGVLLLLGGLSLLLGYHPTIGAALLVIFLLGVSFQAQFLGRSRSPGEDGGDGELHKKYGPGRFPVDDGRHSQALADEFLERESFAAIHHAYF